MDASLSALVESVNSFAQTADEAGRKKIVDTLQSICWSVETPYDSMQRLMYSNQQLPLIIVGLDLDLFGQIVQSSKPVSTAELCISNGASPDLVSRLNRYFASMGIIIQVDKDLWTSNQLTRTLCHPGWIGAVRFYAEWAGPVWQKIPEYVKERKYRELNDPLDTAMASCYNYTGTHTFAWFPSQPALMQNFGAFMSVQRDGQPSCFDAYPFRQKAEGLKPDQPFFVDIGGSVGHQCIALRTRFPDLPNKIILEDLPATLSMAIDHPGVQTQAQDFWKPQVIKGSRIYYLRNIMHDYADAQAADILRKTKDAFGSDPDPEAVILIDEMILPETNAHRFQTQLDMTMMMGICAKERTEEQWKKVVEDAGLKIKNVYTYTKSLNDCLIECVPAYENGTVKL